jgi:predicted DNA-binding protein (UPF0251 family)
MPDGIILNDYLDINEAARRLGINRKTLLRKLKKPDCTLRRYVKQHPFTERMYIPKRVIDEMVDEFNGTTEE